jgi:hypothetical protein
MDTFLIGFLIGGLMTGISMGALFAYVETKRIHREIEKSKQECLQDIHRIMGEHKQNVLSLIDKYERGDDF